MKTAWVGGGNGFIGHHMARRLRSEGYWVRVVDIKEYEYGSNDYADEIVIGDLRDYRMVFSSLTLNQEMKYSYLPIPFEQKKQFDVVLNFACFMGGAGFVFTGEHDADIMHDSALINLTILDVLRHEKFTGLIFYSSSACVYPMHLQEEENNPGLCESDAWPANPDSCYGLEKLFSERLYLSYARNYGLNVRIARFHNIYGPEGTYKGGREKAPAAICRKVIESNGVIQIWGDGEQTRSFLYIDDCIDAVRLLMESDFKQPINIGSEQMVSINHLAHLAILLSRKVIQVNHIDGPVGVRGRNSNNDLIRDVLGWSPRYTLGEGLKMTYQWILSQYDRD